MDQHLYKKQSDGTAIINWKRNQYLVIDHLLNKVVLILSKSRIDKEYCGSVYFISKKQDVLDCCFDF